MLNFYNIFINTIILIPIGSVIYVSFGMAKDYLEVSYSESEKNKKEN